jgi:CDP-diacylglycerol--serine O-phosphatidyltransferase
MWVNSFADVKGFDWAMVLFFACCMAMRLARFNVALNKEIENPTLEKYFFVGIPAPCGAAMAMLPMVLSYEFGSDYFFTDPRVVISYIFVLAAFGPSTIPTISIKKIPIKNEYIYLTFIIISLIITGLLITPWLTLAIIGVTYACSIPITIFCYLKIKNSSSS